MNTKITTFEEAAISINIDPNVLPDVSHLDQEFQERTIANYKLDVINKALNDEGQPETWVADYSNWDQVKFQPYFQFSPVSGWSLLGVDYWHALTGAGARRNYRTREIANYAANQFIDLYSKIL